jgi:hypothetical protein
MQALLYYESFKLQINRPRKVKSYKEIGESRMTLEELKQQIAQQVEQEAIIHSQATKNLLIEIMFEREVRRLLLGSEKQL